MRALTVAQPGASQIASGRKVYVARRKRTSYRGLVLLTSSARAHGRARPHPLSGYALAVCELVDCRLMRPSDAVPACELYRPDRWIWEVRLRAKLKTPVRVHGKPHIWDLDLAGYPGLLAELEGLGLAKLQRAMASAHHDQQRLSVEQGNRSAHAVPGGCL